jgi:hypothetical protein
MTDSMCVACRPFVEVAAFSEAARVQDHNTSSQPASPLSGNTEAAEITRCPYTSPACTKLLHRIGQYSVASNMASHRSPSTRLPLPHARTTAPIVPLVALLTDALREMDSTIWSGSWQGSRDSTDIASARRLFPRGTLRTHICMQAG